MKMVKKSLSVLLAAMMLLTCCIPALNGIAVHVDYESQYLDLAQLLTNEYVRELKNYEIENKKGDDMITEGFNQEAGAFSYTHTVYAKDNTNNEILKAANRFYYIAETLMSSTYGTGCYAPELLFSAFMAKMPAYFESIKAPGYFDMNNQPYAPTLSELAAYENAVAELTAAGSPVNKETLTELGQVFIYQEDVGFYVNAMGERYYPTDEEIAAFDAAVAELTAQGVTEYSFSELDNYDVAFIRVTPFEYYNVEEIITYFMGTGTYTNAGNWYHDFVFIVESDVETMLLEMDSLNSFPSSSITITTGIYRYQYDRQYAVNGTSAQYFFKDGNAGSIYLDYHDEYALGTAPEQIDYLEENANAVGQAANLYTSVSYDTDTINNLRNTNDYFNTLFATVPASEYDGSYYIGTTWDSNYINYSNDQLDASNPALDRTAINKARQLTEQYSNEVLVHLFPDSIGNIKTLQYLMTAGDSLPSRIVRGTATYNPTIGSLNAIVDEFDALFTDEKVMTIVNMFLKETLDGLFVGTAAEGVTANTAQDLVKILLNGMLYSDSMVNLVVGKLYPLIANALVGLLDGMSSTLGNIVDGLLSWAITNLHLALTPEALGDMLDDYPSAQAELRAAGNGYTDWENVVWDNINWTTASAVPLNNQLTFINALAATFRGLKEALLCMFKNDYDLQLLSGTVKLQSQNAYEKLIVPLFEVFGFTATTNAQMEYAGRYYYSAAAYNTRARADTDRYLTDILQPLLYWAENVLAIKPIRTVCELLPNLVNFLIRDNNSLVKIMQNVNIHVTVIGNLIDAYETSLYDLLGDTAKALDSLNHVLDNFVELKTEDEVPYSLPKFHEKKLLECGTLNANNTITVENPGYVLLYLLRYVFTALGYRGDAANADLPYLLECFGLQLDQVLFGELTMGELVFNIMLHPDAALCAVLELFYPNENGDYYENESYVYPLEPINYYTNTLLNDVLNPSLGYGAPVKYSKNWTQENATEVAQSIGPLVDNVLKMLGLEGFENGLGGYLEELIYGFISDETVNMLFNTIYQLLGGVDDSIPIDIQKLLETLFDVRISPQDVAERIVGMLGYQPAAYETLIGALSWKELFTTNVYDPDTGVEVPTVTDVNLEWGVDSAKENGLATGEAFIRVMSALLSPASFLLEFLFLDQDINLLGLLTIPAYAGYQYAGIGLLEALACPASDVLTYRAYYASSVGNADADIGECNTVYGILKPILGLLNKVCSNPVGTVMTLVPNLMFFLSIGGLNDLLNNLVHFAYVLLDIVKPVINGYEVINSLLANLSVGGISLNLSVPLDMDLNALASTALAELLGKSLVLTTVDVKDEEGTVTGTKDISITLPYIDFYTLCAGKLQKFQSAEERRVVHMDADGGGGFLTSVLRLVVDVFFIDENISALAALILPSDSSIDDYDRETIQMLLDKLTGLFGEHDSEDVVLLVLYVLITKLNSLSGTVLGQLEGSGITLMDIVNSMSSLESFQAYITAILNGTAGGSEEPTEPPVTQDPQSGGGVDNKEAAGSFFAKIKAFFDKIILLFKNIFTW